MNCEKSIVNHISSWVDWFVTSLTFTVCIENSKVSHIKSYQVVFLHTFSCSSGAAMVVVVATGAQRQACCLVNASAACIWLCVSASCMCTPPQRVRRPGPSWSRAVSLNSSTPMQAENQTAAHALLKAPAGRKSIPLYWLIRHPHAHAHTHTRTEIWHEMTWNLSEISSLISLVNWYKWYMNEVCKCVIYCVLCVYNDS